MSRIVLLIEHGENRRLLAEWLSHEHEIAIPTSPAVLERMMDFDLGIVDGPSIERYGRWIEMVKRSAEPLFLPFLLVANRRGTGLSTASVWQTSDEIIVSPVEKIELQARVETLLRARALSLTNNALARRLERELARAREVQAGLLPQEAPLLQGFDLAARCIPAGEVGGDFFDWQAVDDSVFLSVGDVMGKGVPAALLAATVRAVLRALALQNPPGNALDLLGRTLSADLERASSFVTLFHARLCTSAREVRYVDAGHGHALVRRASGAVERLERGGRPIGFPAAGHYRESGCVLGSGDALFVYSDGLFEGSNVAPEALMQTLPTDLPAAEIVARFVEAAPRSELVDDVTALVLKCTSGAN